MTRPGGDPVRARRALVDRASGVGRRVGFGLFALAVLVFVFGAVTGFTDPIVVTVIAAIVVGSVVLLPSIVLGYAVKAAEREDLEQGD